MEIFDEADLEKARQMNSEIIQVNSRDLDTLGMDPAKHERLIEHRAPGEFWIAASGIDGGARIKELKNAGYGAFLIGTSLMSGGEPGQALAKILKEAD
jgi:indole-3-glycerol phosphate synthase